MSSTTSSSSSSGGGAILPAAATSAVLQKSTFDASNETEVVGIDFERPQTLDSFVQSFLNTGFQATNVGLAITEINRMINWRLSDRPIVPQEQEEYKDPNYRKNAKATIFLAYTSNMISCGVRETIKYLVKNKLVDVIVTTAGGVEEDFIKCLAPTYLGDFKLSGKDLRSRGVNRLGNLLIPNENYCKFEDWLTPILHKITDEQVASKDGEVRWTPSRLIHRLGLEINHEGKDYHKLHFFKINFIIICNSFSNLLYIYREICVLSYFY